MEIDQFDLIFFPNRLESLTFGDGFNNGNQPLVPGLFPDSLLSLEFGEYFSNGNKPLQPNRFPKIYNQSDLVIVLTMGITTQTWIISG